MTEIDVTTAAPEVLPALAPTSLNPSRSRHDQLLELQAEAQFLDVAYGLAEKACGNGGQMVAQHFRGKPADGAIAIAYGASLGWHWTKSLQDVYVVNGKPSIQSKEMRELLIRAGHTIEEVEVGPTKVSLRGYRAGSDVPVNVTWTIEDAERAGYTSNPNYKKVPTNMLYARATTDLAKRLAPDALSGLGIVEEQQDIERARKVRNEAQAPGVEELRARMGIAAAPKASSDLAAKPETQQADDTQAGTPEPELKKPTAAQNRALNALYERAGLAKENREGRRIVFASFFPDRELGAQPSADETAHVIAQLEQLADSGEDDSVLVAFAEDVITQHAQTAQEG